MKHSPLHQNKALSPCSGRICLTGTCFSFFFFSACFPELQWFPLALNHVTSKDRGYLGEFLGVLPACGGQRRSQHRLIARSVLSFVSLVFFLLHRPFQPATGLTFLRGRTKHVFFVFSWVSITTGSKVKGNSQPQMGAASCLILWWLWVDHWNTDRF